MGPRPASTTHPVVLARSHLQSVCTAAGPPSPPPLPLPKFGRVISVSSRKHRQNLICSKLSPSFQHARYRKPAPASMLCSTLLDLAYDCLSSELYRQFLRRFLACSRSFGLVFSVFRISEFLLVVQYPQLIDDLGKIQNIALPMFSRQSCQVLSSKYLRVTLTVDKLAQLTK